MTTLAFKTRRQAAAFAKKIAGRTRYEEPDKKGYAGMVLECPKGTVLGGLVERSQLPPSDPYKFAVNTFCRRKVPTGSKRHR